MIPKTKEEKAEVALAQSMCYLDVLLDSARDISRAKSRDARSAKCWLFGDQIKIAHGEFANWSAPLGFDDCKEPKVVISLQKKRDYFEAKTQVDGILAQIAEATGADKEELEVRARQLIKNLRLRLLELY